MLGAGTETVLRQGPSAGAATGVGAMPEYCMNTDDTDRSVRGSIPFLR